MTTNKDRVINAIKQRPMTTGELADSGIPRFAVTASIRELYDEGLCHITEYPRIGYKGRRMPRYAYGPGDDAPPPGELWANIIPLTQPERERRNAFVDLSHRLALSTKEVAFNE